MKLKQLFTNYEWCQGALAYDGNGDDINPRNLKAKEFCLLGGLQKCYIGKELKSQKRKVYNFIRYYYEVIEGGIDDTIVEFNDEIAKKDDIKKLVNALDI